MDRLHKARRVRIVVQRCPDRSDDDLENAVVHEHAGPNRIEELRLRDKASLTLGKIPDERKSLRWKFDLALPVPEALIERIDAELSRLTSAG